MNALAFYATTAALANTLPFREVGYADSSATPIGEGRIVGWDAGKGQQPQPRNSPCACGSGKKAKRCCVYQLKEK